MNKKGIEMAVSSIVIIILAIIVLAVLAIGFSTGWGKMWGKLDSYGGDLKETAIDVCNLACAKANVYAFCEEPRPIDSKGTTMTCVDLKVTCPAITCP